jgi:hypothetical protein
MQHMPLFSSDDPAERIGEAIGSIFSIAVYVTVVGLVIVQFLQK